MRKGHRADDPTSLEPQEDARAQKANRQRAERSAGGLDLGCGACPQDCMMASLVKQLHVVVIAETTVAGVSRDFIKDLNIDQSLDQLIGGRIAGAG